eukprot:GHVU01177238.1.p2 GENE.GHVU01177238.1~~GHVU01177238.1.p2  ORF type:complete len:122 (-),score=4.34 GHVU01177238.1:27-392(-)
MSEAETTMQRRPSTVRHPDPGITTTRTLECSCSDEFSHSLTSTRTKTHRRRMSTCRNDDAAKCKTNRRIRPNGGVTITSYPEVLMSRRLKSRCPSGFPGDAQTCRGSEGVYVYGGGPPAPG